MIITSVQQSVIIHGRTYQTLVFATIGHMNTPDFDAVATININAPVEKVWEALTKPEIIKRYFHDTTIATDWKAGSGITWSGVWKEKPYIDRGVVLAFKSHALLRMTHWSPLSGTEDKPENYHTVTYELCPRGETTDLVLTQSNNHSKEAADAMANQGWMPILRSLKSLLESYDD